MREGGRGGCLHCKVKIVITYLTLQQFVYPLKFNMLHGNYVFFINHHLL